MSFGDSLATVAPVYNLGLVLIAIYLFLKLFSTPIRDKRVYLLPWKLIFFSVCVFVLEETLTFLRGNNLVNIPIHINGFFEVLIIGTFIYALLLQREHLRLTR